MSDDKYRQLNKIVAQLRGVMRSGANLVAMCPAHDDKRQSLSLGVNEKGDVLVKCHAGCATEDVVKAIGMTMAYLFADGSSVPVPDISRPAPEAIGAVYQYRDPETGEVTSEVVRTIPKGFKQRRPDGKGGYIWSIGDAKRVLYRLWDVRQLKKKLWKAVAFVEGEKDADRLWALKPPVPTVTNIGGAAKWRPEYIEQLKAAGVERVVILPDNDPAGMKHAVVIAAACIEAGITVRVVELTGLPEKGDVSDYLDAGHSRGDLVREILAAPAYEVPPEQPEPKAETNSEEVTDDEIGLRYVKLSNVTAKAVEWLWPGRIPFGMLTLIAGDAGGGKSFLSEFIAALGSRGEAQWPDGQPLGKVFDTVFLAAEDSLAEVTRPRADAMGADSDHIYVITAAIAKDGKDRMVSLSEDLGRLRALVKKTGAKLIVVDPINAYLGGKVDNYKDPEVRSVLTPLAQMADELRIAVLGIMHLSKAAQATVIYRIGGSVAFAALARAVFFVSRGKDDHTLRLLTNPKMSVAKEADTRGFRIVPVGGTDAAKIVFEDEPIEITAAEAMKEETSESRKTKKDDAIEWLGFFLQEGPKTYIEVMAAANEMGHSKKTVERASKDKGLNVQKSRVHSDRGATGPWVWALPEKKETK